MFMKRNEVSERTLPNSSQAGQVKGLSVTWPPEQADGYFYPWPVDRSQMTAAATAPAFLSLPFWCSCWCWARRPWVGWWEFLWTRNRTWLVLPWQSIPGARYHFSPSHLLKIAPTFHQQRQSRQDGARAFIFKYSILPSKSSDRLGNALMDALQRKARRPK